MTDQDLVDDIAERIMRLREQQIDLALQPKPRWLPKRLWHWLLGRLLRLEERPVDMK